MWTIMVQVEVSIDNRLKEEGEALFRELGITFSEAVSAFVSQAVQERGMPFSHSKNCARAITFASEKALAKDWLLPEEDEAWRNL
jgi:addiction module RelB/DinJ family antitoxin